MREGKTVGKFSLNAPVIKILYIHLCTALSLHFTRMSFMYFIILGLFIESKHECIVPQKKNNTNLFSSVASTVCLVESLTCMWQHKCPRAVRKHGGGKPLMLFLKHCKRLLVVQVLNCLDRKCF